MRYVKILLLHFENVLEHRMRSLVWFLVSLLNPLLYILFWRGAFQGRSEIGPGWTFSSLTSYYFLLTVASAVLTVHIEEDVAAYDIQEGKLVSYLLKPFSYYWFKFFDEINYRILQGSYGLLALVILQLFFGQFIILTNNVVIIILSLVIIFLAYILSFTFKMIIGILAFWMTEIFGIFQIVEVILAIFAGYILPIELLPSLFSHIAKILPFSYMIYFPIVALQGKLSESQLLKIISIQILWFLILYFLYVTLWKRGIKKFTGVGQ